MSTAAADRIISELTTHPKERIGFRRADFDALEGPELDLVFEGLISKLDEGWEYSQKMKWLVGDKYGDVLKYGLKNLPFRSYGLVLLPYFLYKETGDRQYVYLMMTAIVESDPNWDRRHDAIGGCLLELIGKAPLFWDFCRYIILSALDLELKKAAMLWLAYDKKYLLTGLSLPGDLASCV